MSENKKTILTWLGIITGAFFIASCYIIIFEYVYARAMSDIKSIQEKSCSN